MQSQMIRRLIYAFKRQWGGDVDYIQLLTSEVNDNTGERDINRLVHSFKAVVMPISQVRKFIQDIGYLAANKNFTYGALNDYNTFTILIDRNDLPDNFNPDLTGYINYNGKRYERVSMNDIYGSAYLLVTRGVEGALPFSRLKQEVRNILQLQSRVTYELN